MAANKPKRPCKTCGDWGFIPDVVPMKFCPDCVEPFRKEPRRDAAPKGKPNDWKMPAAAAGLEGGRAAADRAKQNERRLGFQHGAS